MICVLTLAALGAQVRASDGYDFAETGLAGAVESFIEDHRINPDSFGMGWYDIRSGESYYYNGGKFFVAGSMYKLPLCMVYTDMLASGGVQPEDRVRGMRIDKAVERAIVYSDNDAAKALRWGISENLFEYRDALAQYSGLDTESLPQSYYRENCISPEFMLGTLRHLYDNSEHYSQLIEYMKQASPGFYFKNVGGDYEIAHKYGSFEGATNDCGIIYTERPFLLVVFSRGVANASKMLGELCGMMADYSVYLTERDEGADYIARASELGLIFGYEDGTFKPDRPVSRAQFVTILWRMAGQPQAAGTAAFADVPETAYYANAVSWANENGYVSGVAAGRFDPDGNITREQAVAILYRYAGNPVGTEGMISGIYDSQFSDSSSISGYAKTAVYWAVYNGIVTGTGQTISPRRTTTRGQVAAIFLRYMQQNNKEKERHT